MTFFRKVWYIIIQSGRVLKYMDDRKLQLLKLVIENYIDTAVLVGSKFLTEHTELKVSATTVRNEMNDLERDGLLTHPYTSAGRILTE